MIRNFKEKLIDVKAFAFDVDGVFTNSLITIMPNGEVIRQFNVKDGLAVVRAIKRGYPIAIISGGRGEQVRERMKELRVEHIYLQSKCKMDDLQDFMQKEGLEPHEVLFVGDDYPDIEAMRSVGVSIAPADGAYAVREIATYTSSYSGGEGVVRDAIEQVLRARGDWYELCDSVQPH